MHVEKYIKRGKYFILFSLNAKTFRYRTLRFAKPDDIIFELATLIISNPLIRLYTFQVLLDFFKFFFFRFYLEMKLLTSKFMFYSSNI